MEIGKSGEIELVGTGLTAKVAWSETYDITLNQSIISIDSLKIKANSSKYVDSYFLNGTLNVNESVVVTFNSGAGTHKVDIISKGTYYTVKTGDGYSAPPWQSDAITHNDDGSKEISISINIKAYPVTASVGTINTSTMITLATIPRASTIISAENIILGNACNIKWLPASSKFQYKIQFTLADWEYVTDFIKPNQAAEYTYDDYVISGTTIMNGTTIYALLPDKTSGVMTAVLTTYGEDGSQLGSSSIKTFNVDIPSDIVPTIGAISLTPETINGNDILVKGKNKLAIDVSNCVAGVGSSIKSYTFSGPSLLITATDTRYVISAVSSIGELTYTVTVTDNRGRTASASKSIECFDYYAPSFIAFYAYRSDENGDPDINGTYLQCEYRYDYADVNNTNNVEIFINYNGSTSNQLPINLGNADTTYNVSAIITDAYGGTSETSPVTVFGQARVLNITADGTGFAIGKMADQSNLFECRWDAKFDSDLECVNLTAGQIGCTELTIDDLNCTNVVADKVDCTEATVTKVSCDEMTIQQKTIFDLIYPVGSIYMSVNSASPATLFGGEWEQLKDRFLLGASDTYSAGSTGGESTVTLTIDQIPSHQHTGLYYTNTSGETKTIGLNTGSTGYRLNYTVNGSNGTDEIFTNTAGSGEAHNNMPPYLAVFMWKRVS